MKIIIDMPEGKENLKKAMEKKIKEEMSIDINVVVTKTDDGKQYRIVCPFCKETHLHGAVALGWREAHCHKGQYRLVEK